MRTFFASLILIIVNSLRSSDLGVGPYDFYRLEWISVWKYAFVALLILGYLVCIFKDVADIKKIIESWKK